MSLSARRAWIEMEDWLNAGALPRSLSARRAWIEIERPTTRKPGQCVALRKESVDRNTSVGVDFSEDWRRSPQGERG